MTTIGSIILFLNMLSYSQGDFSLIIDISRYVPEENMLVISVVVSNKTNKKIHISKCEPHKNCYIDDVFWNLEIFKDGMRYYVPVVLVKKKITIIKIGKQSEHCFQIPVCLGQLSKNGYFTDEFLKSGEYQIKLLTKLIKPNIEIKSNVVSVIVD